MSVAPSDRTPEPLLAALLRGGALTLEAARAALDRQVLNGGALDTALLEVGVSDRAILHAMTEVYDQPLATPAELAAEPHPRSLRAIPEQWAQRHRLVPIALEDGARRLIVLSPAPADLDLLARISELLDLTLTPRIALEVRVVDALRRLYGTKPPDRYLPLLVHASGAVEGSEPVSPLGFSEATERLREPPNRDAVGRALLGFAVREMAFGALWVVHDGELKGWLGFGAGAERLGAAAIAVDDASAVSVVLESKAHYLGPSPDDDTQRSLLEALGRQPPRAALMVPVRVRDRVVALFYGENGPEPIAGRLAGDIMLLVTRVQSAFEQLVLRQKAESGLPTKARPAVAEPLREPEVESEPASPPAQPPRAPSVTGLPDEPVEPPPGQDDDWESVAVDSGDYVKGYELIEPRVLVDEDRPERSAPPHHVVTAPESSVNLPTIESADLGSDNLDRLVPPEMAPRAIAEGHDDSGDLVDSDDERERAIAAASTQPAAQTPGLSPPEPEIEPDPTFESPALTREELEGTTASGTGGRPLSEDLLPDMEMAEPVWSDGTPAAAQVSSASDKPSETIEFEEPEVEEASRTDVTMEAAFWSDANRGLAESLLEDDAEPAASPAISDAPWDAAESSPWASSPGTADSEPPSQVSQPVLLVERVDRSVVADSTEAPVPDLGPTSAPPPNELEVLIGRLGSFDADQRRAAIDRLTGMGPSILPQLIDRFPGPGILDPFNQKTVPPFEACGPLLEVVRFFGGDAHPFVARRLESPEALVRFYAAYFYSSVVVPEIIPRLIQRLHDEEPRICMMAARTLFGYRGHSDFSLVISHLHGRLRATSVAARRHATYLLGLFRDVTAIPLLIDVLDRKDRNLVDVAEDALAEITKQRLGPNARRWRQWWDRHKDVSRIQWLIDGLAAKDEALRRSSAEELRAVTGRDFEFEPDATKRRRDEARLRWQTWWDEQPRN